MQTLLMLIGLLGVGVGNAIGSEIVAMQNRCVEHHVSVTGGVGLRIVEEPFQLEEHKLVFDKSQSRVVATIDGRRPYGITRAHMPICKVKSIELSVNERTYKLESGGMFNAIMNKTESISLLDSVAVQCSSTSHDTCVIRGIFSDAAATFVAEWRIDYGVPERTVLSNDEDIINLFRERKLPPEHK